MFRNRDRGQNRVTGAILEIAIGKYAIRRQSQDPNLAQDRNLHQDPDRDREVNLVVNDREAMIIRPQHCRGDDPADFFLNSCNVS